MKGHAASIFLAAACLSAVPASAAADNAPPLAKPMDVGFRTCALHLSRPGYLTDANSTEFGPAGVKLGGDVPEQVRMLAGAGFTDPIFASVDAEGGTVWIIASAGAAQVCKVTLADTQDALRTRLAVEDAFRKTTAWQYDPAGSGTSGGMMTQAFALNPGRPGPKMVMLLNGPNTIYNNGAGIQVIMTVAIVNPKAQ